MLITFHCPPILNYGGGARDPIARGSLQQRPGSFEILVILFFFCFFLRIH